MLFEPCDLIACGKKLACRSNISPIAQRSRHDIRLVAFGGEPNSFERIGNRPQSTSGGIVSNACTTILSSEGMVSTAIAHIELTRSSDTSDLVGLAIVEVVVLVALVLAKALEAAIQVSEPAGINTSSWRSHKWRAAGRVMRMQNVQIEQIKNRILFAYAEYTVEEHCSPYQCIQFVVIGVWD